ncbi:alpha/beta superfamily hydrolase [Halapricum desulfuricans]|uniref:Alpha/beta superfamily hydrolase n=1 Tax=Halapricum desulfuricans TaxID=2841257 RepID=A0A897NK33_9EURY|nr:alpha/beta fold hydrolase [Halapricum desulfuricans]QSG13097.1 alpha/beta superfamily hydrolase [Halapricum desulfuricans]
MRRRTFLTLTGGSLAAIAGCVGDDTDDTPEETSTGPDTSTSTGTHETTSTGGRAEQPEDAVSAGELLVEDMQAGRFEAAVERFRSDARSTISAGRLEEIWLGYTAVGGSFQGVTDTEETVQSGYDAVDLSLEFDRGTHILRVLVDDQDAPAIVGVFVNDEYSRPEYVDSSAFRAEEATIETDDCLMDGEVTIPAEGDSVPGIVLVHGNDPNGAADMDLTAVGSKAFKDLAEGLASRGVAVFRYDRRSHACPNSLAPEEWTLDNITVDDPLVAIEQLRAVPAVDGDRVAVAGHSLGGMAAPRIAERDGDLAGIAMLAAPARDFYEIFIEQFEHLATVGEHEWDAMAEQYERWDERIDRIKEGDYSDSDIVLGYPGALWSSVDAYDQVATAKAIDTPTFVLQGDRDYQVSPAADFERWQAELADRPDASFELYGGLNHLFQYGEGPSTQTEYALANPVDRAVVEDIASWASRL